MRFSLILLLLLSSTHLMALDSLRMEQIGGKWYIIHQVDPKETLFSLYRRYGVSVDDIMKENPGSDEGIAIGQELRIPASKPEMDSPIQVTPDVPPVADQKGNQQTHVVQPGETLFSISRKYNKTVDEIKQNNNLISNEISIGQTLYIEGLPNKEEPEITTSEDKAEEELKQKIHTVSAGETLFSISRTYGVQPNDIKAWNKLSENTIEIGQQLIIYKPSGNNTISTPRPTPEKEEPRVVVKKETKDTVSLNMNEKSKKMQEQMVEITRKIEESGRTTKVIETGLAEVIEGSGSTTKYLALHRTAEIGTIIQVINDLNNASVFVRVIGKIPDTGVNDKVIVKISQQAYDKLGGGLNNRFPCEISYFPK